MNQRTATVERTTNETDIRIAVNLDGTGAVDVETGVPFFDHMLTAFGRHSLIGLLFITCDTRIPSYRWNTHKHIVQP